MVYRVTLQHAHGKMTTSAIMELLRRLHPDMDPDIERQGRSFGIASTARKRKSSMDSMRSASHRAPSRRSEPTNVRTVSSCPGC